MFSLFPRTIAAIYKSFACSFVLFLTNNHNYVYITEQRLTVQTLAVLRLHIAEVENHLKNMCGQTSLPSPSCSQQVVQLVALAAVMVAKVPLWCISLSSAPFFIPNYRCLERSYMDQNVSPSGQVSMKQVVNIPPSPSIRISVIFFQNLYSVGSAFSTMKHSVNLFHIALALTFDAMSICFAYTCPNSGPLPPTDPVY